VVEEKPILIWVLEQGGYPDFSTLYQALGYRVEKVRGVRKALKLLKQLEPQAVVAEFNYVPTYGSRISPVEPLLARLGALERYSEHPVADAVLRFCADQGIENRRFEAADLEVVPGFGIKARVDGRDLAAGTWEWMKRQGAVNAQLQQAAQELQGQGVGVLYLCEEGRVVALLGLEDQLREDAAGLVASLRREGMRLTLLSGDRRQVAERIAEQLGGMEVIAEVLPQDKDRVIAELQSDGHQVAMVGDGINDAPALVRADVGIALGSGTDVSIASADIVLMSSELDKVRLAAGLARRTLRTIRQNIAISITYNVIMVPLAMAAFVTPLVAAVSMPLSSLAVIGNSARIRTLFKR